MKRYCSFAVVLCGVLAANGAIAEKKQCWTFADAKLGTPNGWIVGATGAKRGKAPLWKVIDDSGRHVLAQLESGGENGDFPVCLKKESSFRNGIVSVRLKPISGSKDQAGGVIFRGAGQG